MATKLVAKFRNFRPHSSAAHDNHYDDDDDTYVTNHMMLSATMPPIIAQTMSIHSPTLRARSKSRVRDKTCSRHRSRDSRYTSIENCPTSTPPLPTKTAYLDNLPNDIEPARILLQKYSRVRRKDIDSHINSARENLWSIYPYSCIGHFRFLSLGFTEDVRYQRALRMLSPPRSNTTFLDVGCCVGQILRQLAFDGVDSRRLYGTDIEPRFVDQGYQLFLDKDTFHATFVTGDILKGNGKTGGDERLNLLDGNMDIIHATSFFHLFTWHDQVTAAVRLSRFLKSAEENPNAMIFGRQVGTIRPGDNMSRRGYARYLHNEESWQSLWDEVGRITGTKWRTEVEPYGELIEGGLQRIQFGVYRA